MPHKSKARNNSRASKNPSDYHRQVGLANETARSMNGDVNSTNNPSMFSRAKTNFELVQDRYATTFATNSSPTSPRTKQPVGMQETIGEDSDHEDVLLFRGRNQTGQSERTPSQAHQEDTLAPRRSRHMESQNSFSKRVLDASAKTVVVNDNALADYIENIRQGNLTDRSNESTTLQPSHVNQEKLGFDIDEKPLPNEHRFATTESRLDEDIVENVGGNFSPAQRDPPSSVPSADQAAEALADVPERRLKESAASSLYDSKMTDEEMARRLSKQEELGLGSAEVLLFNGTDDVVRSDSNLDDPDLAFLRNEAKQYVRHSKKYADGNSRSLLAALDEWSSDAEEDQYGEFDILDTERPSLQMSGGKRSRKWPDLVGSSTNPDMILAWEKDRLKKGLKKQERELLRAQGLLGNGTGNALKAKYPEGMIWDSIRDELKSFLLSSRQTLTLVPMDKTSRRIVHEIANRFGIKSRSNGSGHQRYPCLIKTKRTRTFNEDVFSALEGRFTRRFFPRMDKVKAARNPQHRAHDTGSAYVAYRDGEVVGATAPELGAENRGRAMLEKMGWSSGTALGALDNKGLLIPLSHTVKKTRTGLG